MTAPVIEQARWLYRDVIDPLEDCIDGFEMAVIRAVLWNHGVRDCQDMRHFASHRPECEDRQGDLDEFESLLGRYAPSVGLDPEAALYRLACRAKGNTWDRRPARVVVPFYSAAGTPAWLLSVGFDVDAEFDVEIWKPEDTSPVQASRNVEELAKTVGIEPARSSEGCAAYSCEEISVLLTTLHRRYPDLALGNYRSKLIGPAESWRFVLRRSVVQDVTYTALSLLVFIKTEGAYQWFEESHLCGQSYLYASLSDALRDPTARTSYHNVAPLTHRKST